MNKKQVLSWCLFDFANSSYSAVIAAVVFQVYYINRIVGNGGNKGDLWWGAAISASMLFVSLSSPFLGGIADYAGLRKRLLAFYTYRGTIGCPQSSLKVLASPKFSEASVRSTLNSDAGCLKIIDRFRGRKEKTDFEIGSS